MDIICFEKHYADQPEKVEFSVRYDKKPYLHDKNVIGYVTLQHLDDITVPVTELSWLIKSLQRIKDEI
jgi:hypothetical protein